MTTITSFTKALTLNLLILDQLDGSAAAATFVVTNTNDIGAGSLRQAVLDTHAAAGADTIVFDPAFFGSPRTITLASVIALSRGSQPIDNVTIIGPGPNLLTISGNNVTDHFSTDTGDTTSISGMTLTAGNGSDGGSIGNAGITTLTNIVFAQNTSNSGGAIYNGGNGTTSGF